jgi:hypothetical protein
VTNAAITAGYLPEEVYGYALAKFAVERREDKPQWAKHLSTDVRSYFKNSHAWLEKNSPKFGGATAGRSGQVLKTGDFAH